jgi:hypothetical protein
MQMKQSLIVAGLLAGAGLPGWCDPQKGIAARAPTARPAPLAARPGGIPKAAPPGRGPRLTDPSSPATWLYRATPEQREQAIEKLRPAQQQRIRQNLEWFDGLSKEDQAIVISRTERFSALPPEKRFAFRAQMQALNRLPQPRRQAVRSALVRLQRLADERRAAILESAEFRSRFSADEQKMIADLSEVMLPGEMRPPEK